MKVESIYIQNFKKFQDLRVSFKNKILDEVSDRFLILGDNGSGKTTLLQAIALPLALATGRIQKVSDFDWIGFLPGRYWKWGTPRIELEVSFEEEELEATRKIAKIWYDSLPSDFRPDEFIQPGNSRVVKVILNGEHWKAGNTPEERAQFRGRYYAQSFINRGDQSVRHYFSQLPGIFWFDQFRNLGTPSQEAGEGNKELRGETSFDLGVGRLRQYLIRWKRRQEVGIKHENDYLQQLERLYKKVFPDRCFVEYLEELPSLESPTEETTYFLLSDGNRTYDIAEMSAGEQSIFPILYEFVRQQIAYAVVLIDEIDLNLHPSASQFLTGQLMRIAPTCQFIITTHSEAVSNVISENDRYRLSGGVLCL
ncbi:MAG: AAA family ATPase [Sphaerospermopsis sp.]|uniref:AAA family ATPase n=1 Tax=Sphaerospermopsis aphanizomenoides LEGE 00250 TaxID=2777972 RepID=A0ABR9VBY1_9CYAN|nr:MULTISPECIES: ATP-binding protein [Sphaerospermopsis]MBC5794819.1 AAA family ATPase [Sphaerospermopsis sp. LEGE 00249]MBE9235996.1 AAA family ATPase [Sphaerospermopsis aphanizomenoides LEGE 00250]MEB3147428.1 AAA family ATPase [Sphaerospermopsis sp.]